MSGLPDLITSLITTIAAFVSGWVVARERESGPSETAAAKTCRKHGHDWRLLHFDGAKDRWKKLLQIYDNGCHVRFTAESSSGGRYDISKEEMAKLENVMCVSCGEVRRSRDKFIAAQCRQSTPEKE